MDENKRLSEENRRLLRRLDGMDLELRNGREQVNLRRPRKCTTPPYTDHDAIQRGILEYMRTRLYLEPSREALAKSMADRIADLVTGRLVDLNRYNMMLLGRKAVGKTSMLIAIEDACTLLPDGVDVHVMRIDAEQHWKRLRLGLLACVADTVGLQHRGDVELEQLVTHLEQYNQRVVILVDELQGVYMEPYTKAESMCVLNDVRSIAGSLSGRFFIVTSGSSSHLRRLAFCIHKPTDAIRMRFPHYTAAHNLNSTKLQPRWLRPVTDPHHFKLCLEFIQCRHQRGEVATTFTLADAYIVSGGLPGVMANIVLDGSTHDARANVFHVSTKGFEALYRPGGSQDTDEMSDDDEEDDDDDLRALHLFARFIGYVQRPGGIDVRQLYESQKSSISDIGASKVDELVTKHSLDVDEEMYRALTFLYANEVDEVYMPYRRHAVDFVGLVEAGHELVAGDAVDDHERTKIMEKYDGARQRLLRMMTTHDVHGDRVPDDVQSWEQFIDKCPQWNDSRTSFVFHRDHPKVTRHGQPNCLVQRVQRSGLCYLHGPDVLQHYLVAMGTDAPTKHVPMIDLTKFVLDTFSGKKLKDHIFEDAAGQSLATLDSMLAPGSQRAFRASSEIKEATLRQYGPALVSTFEVREEFQQQGRFVYVGSPDDTPSKGGHAMVLIGVRREGADLRFLLQNWWTRKQFVEMDAEYMQLSHAAITFVETEQAAIPERFQVSSDMYGETEMAGGEDRMPYDAFPA